MRSWCDWRLERVVHSKRSDAFTVDYDVEHVTADVREVMRRFSRYLGGCENVMGWALIVGLLAIAVGVAVLIVLQQQSA